MDTASKNEKSKLSKLLKEKARTRRIVVVLACFVGFCIAFFLGFAFRSQVSLMESIGVPIGEESTLNRFQSKANSDVGNNKSMKSVYNSLSKRVDEVEDLLSQNSFDSIDIEQSTTDAITAMLKSTGDSFAKYYSAAEYSKIVTESKANPYAGVGVTFNETSGRVYVADVFDGSEAELKGVKAGDYIKSINGENQVGKSAVEVRNLIANKINESLMINLVHPLSKYGESGDEYSVSLTCASLNVPNVTSEISDGLAYINIHQFNEDTASILSTLVKQLDSEDIKAFVIDVRNNPGGYMSGALDSASYFLKTGTLVTIESADGNQDRTTEGETITKKPVVLLTNSNTAAAAEVFVAALHDNNRASVVGEKTAGKGIFAATSELSFGGAVRYTAAKYITPNGNSIQDHGIDPDIDVAGVDDYDFDTEPLRSAIDSAISISSR
ncbi:S41 family peptidase [Phoenicibacter congonensis]|uniref:S41 family peptidase n=1 Tax=Phoenicibacter congonensis TaxID=1944646 RepID=UPI0009A55E64|nr:S41 family peptidase [Phoenicibacter congonensis]